MADKAGMEIGTAAQAVWRLALALFVLLVAACGIWIAVAGPWEAIADSGFQYLLFAAVFVGILVAGRFTMRWLWEGTTLNRRNAMLGSRRNNWFPWF